MVPTFDGLSDRPGVEIVDPVESVRFELWTDASVQPDPVSTEPFPYPMDSAVEIRTTRLEVPKLADVLVRDEDGQFVDQYDTSNKRTVVERGRYDLDLTTAPMKLHLLVESDLEIARSGDASVVIDFGEETVVTVGARSFHERPAGTITVSDAVEDLMRAVSLFGSALKTTSPERSFPTLRGHPPRISVGDQFRATRGIESPDTGVEIAIPAKRRLVFAVAPLAYYLGAEVVPGDWPRIRTAHVDHPLPRPPTEFAWERETSRFEQAVYQLLQRVFFLDCLTRTEGIYPLDLYEREALEDTLDLDFAHLYEQPLSTRLEAYLDVPYGDIESYLPTWHLLVDVVPTVETAELLPYLVNDLALIRTNPTPEHRHLRPNDDLSIELFGEQGPVEPPNADNPDVHDMSYEGLPVDLPPANTLEHAFAGDGYPEGSNKLRLKAFENQLRGPKTDGTPINVSIVLNDEDLADMRILPHVYNDRNLLDVDVSLYEMVETDELAAIMEEPTHFLHYVGPVTEEGMVCPDGVMLPRDVYPLGVESFFLSRCEHYSDAEWLIERGAHGGIACTTVLNGDPELVMGRWLTRLLGNGFTLRAAAEIANDANMEKMDYVVFGDGGYTVTQHATGRPTVVDVARTGNESYEIAYRAYPHAHRSIGGIHRPHIENETLYHIVPNVLPAIDVSADELESSLAVEGMPVHVEGNFAWSDEPGFDRYL